MHYKFSFLNLGRATVLSIALLAALTVGTVAAESIDIGLTECDHGCEIATLSSIKGGAAAYQVVSVTPLNFSAYVSNAPGELGFTP